jgi:Asp-tRNA(Asn)/Glu-tRNA(Gln) amidotransferase A subunit family amidase
MNIREVADLVRKKKVSPVELTTACLARIDRFNPALNAFIRHDRISPGAGA